MLWKYILIYFILVLVGSVVGAFVSRQIILRCASDGVCIRADDGEVYLRLSEIAQRKLADPSTDILVLRVIDSSTRNKPTL